MQPRHLLASLACLVLIAACSPEKDATLRYDENLTYNGSSNSDYVAFDPSGEGYNTYEENPFVPTSEQQVSTFSIDADGASYANTRRFLQRYGQRPPRDAIRTEEHINYFNYDYPEPEGDHPIALEGELSGCPWNPGHRLLRIGIKGKSIPRDQLPPSNFVLLIDVSGSMSSADKLELAKVAFAKMVQWLQPHDRVAIVTYAGSSGVALPSTPGDQKQTILDALFALQPGGSTNGAEGILTAYQIAEEHFVEGGNNRVILATDGDFNVGISNQNELVALIEEKRASGVFLTVLGFGTGNLQDGKMEQIANHGNGTYEYIDSEKQAEKVFVQEFGKFYTVAKDVKVQIRFNEQTVKAWRLIGYENRLLQNEDFEDDTKDAGEIGAGQCITALYELVPQTVSWSLAPAITVDFRYKQPDSEASIPLTLELFDEDVSFAAASPAQKFAAAVAAWAMLLRESEYAGSATWDLVEDWAQQGMSYDPFGFKAEFLDLVDLARNAQ